jgi:hypothetical protein
MGALSAVPLRERTEINRPLGPPTDHLVEDGLAGVVWHLWGQNAPAKLAAILKCSPRTVERYIEGARDWSGDAIAAIVSEILKRHSMRNVRIRARP